MSLSRLERDRDGTPNWILAQFPPWQREASKEGVKESGATTLEEAYWELLRPKIGTKQEELEQLSEEKREWTIELSPELSLELLAHVIKNKAVISSARLSAYVIAPSIPAPSPKAPSAPPAEAPGSLRLLQHRSN